MDMMSSRDAVAVGSVLEVRATPQVSVIGSMILDPRTVPLMMQTLTVECFSDPTCRHAFEAIKKLWSSKQPIDPVMVMGEMGGEQYSPFLAGVMRETPTAANCKEYAELVLRQHEFDAIRSACFDIATGTVDLDEARQKLSEAARLLVRGSSRVRRYSYLDLINRFLDRQNDETPRDYLDFGISAMNKRVHVGMGDFVILGAYSSVGKTAFALQLARSISGNGKKVGFYSYETNEEHVGDRMMANAASISLQAIKEKQMSADDWENAVYEGSRAERFDFELIESAHMNVEDLRNDILAYGFQVVFVDYVQIIPGRSRAQDRKEIVADTSMSLHLMCQELGITVIALSQVTLPEKTVTGKRRWVSMQDLRESKQLLQDGETIILMDLENPQVRDSDRVLIVDKNKDGPVGKFFLKFDAEHMRFFYREDGAEPSEKGGQSKKQKGDQIPGQANFVDLPDDSEIPF